MVESYRRQRRPRLDTEPVRYLSGVFPLSERVAASHKLMSTTADALGVRDGVVLADNRGVQLTLVEHIVVMCTGEWKTVLSRITRNADTLGYVRRQMRQPDIDRFRTLSFEHSWVLPTFSARVYAAGESVPLPTVDPYKPAPRFIVPEGACGVSATLEPGRTLSEEGHGPVDRPSAAAREHFSSLGLDVSPPAKRELQWRWWWHREAVHRRLERAAGRLGVQKHRVSAWHVGPEGVGPYTYGVASILPGAIDEIRDLIFDSATRLGIHRDFAIEPMHTSAHSSALKLTIITYPARENMMVTRPAVVRDDVPQPTVIVPTGSSGVLLGLTCNASPSRHQYGD